MKKRTRAALVTICAAAAIALFVTLAACTAQGGDVGLAPQEGPAAEASPALGGDTASQSDRAGEDASSAQVAEEAAGSTESAEGPAAPHAEDALASPEGRQSQAPAVQAPVAEPAVAPAKAAQHEHSWEPVLEPREVVDIAAWDETRYRTVERTICSVCGEDVTDGDGQGRSALQHGKAHALAGQGGGTYSATKQVPAGTVRHPAQTHTEHVTVGYRCPGCGATK